MSTMLLVWLMVFVACTALAIQRSAWAVALYMLTFFMSPPFWWWGDSVSAYRWNLFAGVILLLSTLVTGAITDPLLLRHRVSKWFITLAILLFLNALFVHVFLAPNIQISSYRFNILFKSMVLFVLMLSCIRSQKDLTIVLTSMLLGAAYIGYEVTVNDRGHVYNNRLEGVGVPNATSANGIACLIMCMIPLIAPLFLYGRLWQKTLAIVAGPLLLNILFLCNSRGAFLASGILVAIFFMGAPKKLRPQVLKISCLGLIAGWMLLGDPRIVERFLTTFESADQRDASAESRLDFWKAGLFMVFDHPLGAGGDGFGKVHGAYYIGNVTGVYKAKSVHQGYLNEACDWGIQGLAIRLMIVGGGILLSLRTSKLALLTDQSYLSMVAISVAAALSALMFQSLFGTFLDNEWGLWLVAISVGCNRIVVQEIAEHELELLQEEAEHDLTSSRTVMVAMQQNVVKP